MRDVTSPRGSLRRRYPAPYTPDTRPTKPQSTRTSADKPSTRRASPNAAGTVPPRNTPAVRRHRPKVAARPPMRMLSFSLRGPSKLPSTAVRSGTNSVAMRTLTLPLQPREAADVHRLEPIDDAADEDAEHEHGEHHVERN